MTSESSHTSLPDVGAPQPGDGKLSDSPWFWVALFGGLALVSLLGIQGKFSQRQARLEQRYQDGLLTQQARENYRATPPSDLPAASDAAGAIEPGYEDDGQTPVGVNMLEARAKTSLFPLVVVAAAMMLIGVAGVLRRGASGRSNTSSGTPE